MNLVLKVILNVSIASSNLIVADRQSQPYTPTTNVRRIILAQYVLLELYMCTYACVMYVELCLCTRYVPCVPLAAYLEPTFFGVAHVCNESRAKGYFLF